MQYSTGSMAKSIKAIECSKCGSIPKTVVRPDVFRGESCSTEYYLNNDDINYTVRQPPKGPAALGMQFTDWSRAAVASGVAVVGPLPLLRSWRYATAAAGLGAGGFDSGLVRVL